MSDLPPLFDKRGAFIPLDADTLATLTPEQQERYAAVADAAENMTAADADVAACRAERKAAVDAGLEAEKHQPKPMTREQLVKDHIASERARRVARQ
jgi:hypothetical protein